MKKRVISLLVGCALLLGIAAMCSSANTNEQPTPTGTSGTGTNSANSSPSPTIIVTAPMEGSIITGDSVTVKVDVKNYDIVDFKTNATPKTGQGHVHLWLDTDVNDPKVAYKLVSGDSAVFDKLPTGEHTLTVQLVSNDHKPVEPAVKRVVHFKTETNNSPPLAAGKTYNIDLSGFAFSQTAMTIEAGSKVTFTNRDDVNHTATAKDGSFDSGALAKGKSYTVTFAKPGTYEIYCKPHPKMTTTITVK